MPPVFYGVFFHWLGGLASGSFYVPYKAVKKWSWEVYWLAGGFFSWIIAPWLLGFILTKGLVPTIFEGFATAPQAMGWAYLFGCLWGIGGLTFGLTMRYLGMSLGMAIALGYCTVLGTIMPPIVDGSFGNSLVNDPAFVLTLLGLGVCALGIILAGIAGTSKEREMDEEAKKAAVKEFNFGKGLLVATISGIFSACMAYGLQAAEPLAVISAAHGTGALWVGLPKLCVVLLGGFTTNFIWCALLLSKNKTWYQFKKAEIKNPDAAKEGTETVKVNMPWNYFFSALAGTVWYFQFFFYSMGETKMGEFKFSSWTLHMASIIIFSSLWGLALHEWKGTSRFTKFILAVAIGTLLYSTIEVGYANLMKTTPANAAIVAMKDATGSAATMFANVEKADAQAAATVANKLVAVSRDAATAAQKAAAEAAEAAAQKEAKGPKALNFVAKGGDFASAQLNAKAAVAAAAKALEAAKGLELDPKARVLVDAFPAIAAEFEAAQDADAFQAVVDKLAALQGEAPAEEAAAPTEAAPEAAAPAEEAAPKAE